MHQEEIDYQDGFAISEVPTRSGSTNAEAFICHVP